MARKPPKQPPADVNAPERAVAWFRERVLMSDDEFSALEDANHDRAFTMAGVAQLDLVEDVWAQLDRAVANGETLEDFQQRIGDRLASAWGSEQPWRVETIFRNNVQRAYNVGRWEQMSHPAVIAARPYKRLSNIMDGRTSPICVDVDEGGVGGTVLPADDPWWLSHVPPLHHACRSTIVTLSSREARSEGIDDAAPAVRSADGFGAAPDPDDDSYEPDLGEYPPALASAYREEGE